MVPSYQIAVKDQKTEQGFYIEQYFVVCLAEFSYYIESAGQAVVIDPLRETQNYMNLLASRNAKLMYVFETHFHADFISGHLDLAQKTGAQIVYGPNAITNFEIKSVKDGEEIVLGNIKFRVLHTPGHTLESTCYVLLTPENKEYCVFTGDTLFLGEVGRPDLAVQSDKITVADLSGMLYDSLRDKLMKLPDDCILFPTHGAGSSCGKSIGAGSSSTIGIQKATNYALQADLSKSDFIKLNSNISKAPQYFKHDATMNKEGPELLEKLINRIFVPLDFATFQQEVSNGALVLDTRDILDDGLIDGAINIAFSSPFATWVGILIKPDQRLVLITQIGQEELTTTRLTRIGYQNIAGHLQGGFEVYSKHGGKFGKVNIVPVTEFMNTEGGADKHIFLDVRQPGEWAQGVLKDSLCITLEELASKVQQIPKGKNIHVYCKMGQRARMAATIVRNAGFEDLTITTCGGLDALVKENGLELIPYQQ